MSAPNAAKNRVVIVIVLPGRRASPHQRTSAIRHGRAAEQQPPRCITPHDRAKPTGGLMRAAQHGLLRYIGVALRAPCPPIVATTFHIAARGAGGGFSVSRILAPFLANPTSVAGRSRAAHSKARRALIHHSIFSKQRKAALCCTAVALLALTAGASAARAQAPTTSVKATHGAWQVRCGQAPGAKQEKCALVQSVKAEDRPNVALTVIFLRSYDGKKQMLRVVAPLGVLLPTGIGLKIDNVDVGNAPFLKCGADGCVTEITVNDDVLGKMKTGKNAVFIIFQTPEFGIGVPIALAGFADGVVNLN
ncbi:MAG: invasion associated locus B family protein [Hyphomicrobiales bacterium]|nr:invasion associated locus B family protein [Hyphomicrobiales bacterium]